MRCEFSASKLIGLRLAVDQRINHLEAYKTLLLSRSDEGAVAERERISYGLDNYRALRDELASLIEQAETEERGHQERKEQADATDGSTGIPGAPQAR